MKNLTTLVSVVSFIKINAQINVADSLFLAQNYKAAKAIYLKEKPNLNDKALQLNRLGYCFHKTNKIEEAIPYYLQSEKLSSSKALNSTVQARLARAYSIKNQNTESLLWLKKAVGNGYANTREISEDPDFKNLRSFKPFKPFYDSLMNASFPCRADKKRRMFDFWIGEWTVFTTQGNQPAGESIIQIVSEGCLILENWKGVNGYSGKSMNFVNEKGDWEQIWMGSDGNVTRFGSGNFINNEMFFQFESTVNGTKKIGKFHFYKLDDNTVRQMQESSTDNGKTFTIDYDLTYKRKK